VAAGDNISMSHKAGSGDTVEAFALSLRPACLLKGRVVALVRGQ
jgi:hypothetical protein